MDKLKYLLILFVALTGCSSSPKSPSISPNEDGLRTINPPGYVSRFCVAGSKRNIGGIAEMPEATQFAIGKCNVNLFDKEDVLVIYFGDDTEMADYTDTELDAYLHPEDYMDGKEVDTQNPPTTVALQSTADPSDKKIRGALVHFEVDSDVPMSVVELQRVAQVLRGQTSKVAVIGHADSTFTEAHNMPLSVRRAKKVKEILVSFGVPEDRISVAGKSSHEPVATNKTKDGRAKNRRAEIKEGEDGN